MNFMTLDHRFESGNPTVVICMGLANEEGNFIEVELDNKFGWKVKHNCLDKQKRYNLTTKQLLDLFIEGETELDDGLKLYAVYEPEKWETLVKKLIDLEKYKRKVKETIDKDWLLFSDRKRLEDEFLNWANKNNAKVCPMNVIAWFHPKIQNRLKKELGLM